MSARDAVAVGFLVTLGCVAGGLDVLGLLAGFVTLTVAWWAAID